MAKEPDEFDRFDHEGVPGHPALYNEICSSLRVVRGPRMEGGWVPSIVHVQRNVEGDIQLEICRDLDGRAWLTKDETRWLASRLVAALDNWPTEGE